MPLITSFYAMLCPCGAAYSLDALRAARKRGGTLAEPLISPWPMRMLQMQLCLIYFQSCVIKSRGPLWLNGTTVHYVLHNREFAFLNMEWLTQYPLVINVMTHGAMLIQYALAFWLWFRPTRRWAMLGGVALHTSLRVMLNIPGFGEPILAIYFTFLAPDELDAVLRALDPRAWLARLGVSVNRLADWSRTRDPAPIAPWQQLEIPFEQS
jgi:Vitamin K-dependent gamma-carboxylase